MTTQNRYQHVAAYARKQGVTAYDTALISVVQYKRGNEVDLNKALGRENRAAEMGLQLIQNMRNAH